MSPASPCLHGKEPAAGGTDARFVVSGPLNRDILPAGSTQAGFTFCTLMIVIEKIGREYVLMCPPFQTAGDWRNRLHTLNDLTLPDMLPLQSALCTDVILKIPQAGKTGCAFL